ncbi:MAG: hypothetical protein AB1668_01545 [Nanoarchaeota archaeon]
MYLKLDLKRCLEELKRGPFLVSDWKTEILKAARAMELSGKSYDSIIYYLQTNLVTFRDIKQYGYADLVKKPIAEIQAAIEAYNLKHAQRNAQRKKEEIKGQLGDKPGGKLPREKES